MSGYIYSAGGGGGGDIVRIPRFPDLGAAVQYGTAAAVVAAPVTVGEVTTFRVDATEVDGEVFWVMPILDPDGLPHLGDPPWTTPYLFLELVTPPSAGSDVELVAVISDNANPLAVGSKWMGGGITFTDPTDPRPMTVSNLIGTAENTPVPGGTYLAFDGATTPSNAEDLGQFSRFARAQLRKSKKVATDSASEQLIPLIDIVGQPFVALRFKTPGTSINTDMTIAVKFSYLTNFRQPA